MRGSRSASAGPVPRWAPARLLRWRVSTALAVAALLWGCGPETAPPADSPGGGVAEELRARAGAPVDPAAPLTTIAFGSCNRTDLPQPLWEPIVAAEPDLWIWLGDNVYADTDDVAVMRAKYEAQLAQPGYARLLATAPVVGTWDDHDYGRNDGGREYGARAESQRELLDFLGEPPDSPRRTREGVYSAYTYGTPPEQVKVILLDVRYHRGPPGDDSTILGDAQWGWLEEELTGSDAQLHLVASGIQVLPEDHRFEKWANFPGERARLLKVIARSGAPGVVLLSGDRHISEISRVTDAALPYPLWEVTSSGLTHSWADNPGEENRHRVGPLYTQLGFGVIEIDWAAGRLELQLRDGDGGVAVSQEIDLATLQGG